MDNIRRIRLLEKLAEANKKQEYEHPVVQKHNAEVNDAEADVMEAEAAKLLAQAKKLRAQAKAPIMVRPPAQQAEPIMAKHVSSPPFVQKSEQQS